MYLAKDTIFIVKRDGTMGKKIAIIWLFVFVLATGIIILFGTQMVENVRYRGDKQFEVKRIDGWEVECDRKTDAEGMYTVTYRNTLGEITPGGDFLLFYIYHADTYVYVDGQLMYSMVIDESESVFDTVSGDTWNAVFLEEKYAGSDIEIVVKTEYSSYLKYVPDFYFGDRATIVKDEFIRSIVSLLLSVAIFMVGMVIVIYSLIVRRTRSNPYSIIYLGVFAILLAIWFIINMPIINMVFDNGTTLTYVSYIILGAIIVPFILFEKSLVNEVYDNFMDGLCLCCIALQLVLVILQILDFMDMKESLICTHVSLGVGLISIVVVILLNMKRQGLKNISYMNKVNFFSGIGIAVGVTVDMVHFYIDPNGGRDYVFTKVTFLMYIIILCYNSMRETQRLMRKGREAKKLEKLAYRDELTGVLNRTACNDYMKKLDLDSDSYSVIMFDLNNLKQCNDTWGHNAGDDYIIGCADAIQEAFQMVGECYRIGGDEFCVIGKNVSDETIQSCYCVLGANINMYNMEHPEMQMSVAYGHAQYDARKDEDLKDTRGRADKIMYKNKMEMKSILG